MIRCPKCNTLNRDSSRFCSECGAPLHKTRIRCPQCGTLNPVGNIFCDHCHVRLLPAEDADSALRETKPSEETLPRVQGISLPTRPSPASEDGNADEQAELPDWLMGFLSPEGAEPEATAEAAASLGNLSAPDEEEGELLAPSELPDWLSGLGAEEEVVSAAPEAELEPAEGLPDWLSGLGAEEEAFSAAPEAELEPAEDLPDWLSGMMEEPVAATAAATALEPEPAPAAEEFPDWLSGMMGEILSESPSDEDLAGELDMHQPAADLEPAALPDWLAGIADESPETVVKPSPEKQETPARAEAPLPDWLSTWEEGAGAKPAEAGADLPDLDDEDTWPEQEALVPESKPESAGVAEPAEVPEWLRALGPRPDAAGVESPPEGLEQAEVPIWLEQLRPPGTAPLDASLAPEVAPGEETSEGGLARAEIPEWVQQYRPTSTSAAEAASLLDAVLESTPESEGPLSGLAGLLPALPVVDAPAQLGSRMTPALSQTVVQEAQLWQQLLERGAGDVSARPKTRARAAWAAVVIRVVVALALALVSVLRFTEAPLALPPEQPAVVALQTSIEALQPADTVLVAFEYTLADVDEMNFVVEVLLEHLLTREVRIVAVSTLPEGPGIIEERFAWASIRPDVYSANLVNGGFVTGGAAGVASILASPVAEAEPAMVLVITSRPEKLKAWVEQHVVANGMRAAAGKPALPLAAGVSAATAPQIRPYLDASVDSGWLSGFSGVASYWQARGLPPREDISRRLDALLLTQWVAASFLLAGAIFYGLAGKQRTV